ncbi:MAG TPA: hypothetical protein VKV21_10765 [Solirubrobacteraceae bacterium]|nr:hypothetical protein [Solirubrobacteraceae bacterium]
MSALADGRARTGSRPPAYLPLALATLPAQILTGLILWTVQLPLALLGIGPASLGNDVWLPWSLAGVWSALGLAGYVLIVCLLGGALSAARVADHGIARPGPGWAWLAFGASGYGALALGQSPGARLALAVVLAPLTLRLFAYRVDGTRRAWPSRPALGRRGAAVALLAGTVLALSYAATHAFAQNGSAGTPSAAVAPGGATVLVVGLQGTVLPAHLTAVTLDGRRIGALQVVRVALAGQFGAGPDAGGASSGTAGASAVPGPAVRALPVDVPARAGAWVAVGIRLLGCPSRRARIDAITLRYRVLGIATSERVPLWSPARIACRATAPAHAATDSAAAPQAPASRAPAVPRTLSD